MTNAIPDRPGSGSIGQCQKNALYQFFEDGIPEIAQARRLGHRLGGVRGIYSHVTSAMEQAIADVLQHRWDATCPFPDTMAVPWDLDEPDAA